MPTRRQVASGAGVLALLAPSSLRAQTFQRRDDVFELGGPYSLAFYGRHNGAYRTSAALHFAHGRAHDVLQLTPLAQAARQDAAFERESLGYVERPPRIEPTMEYYGPYVGRMVWDLYRAIDWTHMHHEQTYDILSARDIAWGEKKRWTDRAVAYYLRELDIPRSVAPLDVTMRRAAVMAKPYFTYFRNRYPLSNSFFYYAHWWHPTIYEAMLLGGNGDGQERAVAASERVGREQVLRDRPRRMLLSRELMPRYARMSPESANIFDNLHMLHGIAYDCLAYEGWDPAQKRAEIERVLRAMAQQPGDAALARMFRIPHPETDPRLYPAWMRGTQGEMNRIMLEMTAEMMPLMLPGMSARAQARMTDQMRMKLTPAMQEGEAAGSPHDAMMAMMPEMRMMPGAVEPGMASPVMVEAMLAGWREKHGGLADIEPWDMGREPALAEPGAAPPAAA